MTQIFISYSSKSRDVVSALAKDFQTAGYEVWFDEALTGGQSWWDQILTNLRACEIFAFALTPEALESEACKREYNYAYALGKPILPVLLTDGVSTNLLPPILTRLQYVDYRKQDKQAAFMLMRALSDVTVAPPLPDPLPEPPQVPISYLSNLREQIESLNVLTFQEQSALVLRLKQGLQEGENIDDIRSLLVKLKKRDDLLAKVGDEINSLLLTSGGLPDVTPVPIRREPMPPGSYNPEPLTSKVSSAANIVGTVSGEAVRSAAEGFNAARSRTTPPGSFTPSSPTPSSMPPTTPPPSSSNYRPPSQPYQGASGVTSSQPLTGNPWTSNQLAALYIGALFTLGIVGIIGGLMGLGSDGKKSQAKTLLILSVLFLIFGIISASSMSTYGY
ncbi:MAG: toll/interleukin-1 receptor domain-containing protein [Burkholderiales bacterium]|nr:toll/interleukin-1 receptor domain-containing protein [Anaerolineae bacterium]